MLFYIRTQGNKGQATIAVDSFSEDEGLYSGSSSTGSIHLKLEKSEFSFERVGASVIVTSGAKVSSIGNVFEKNIARSMIETHSGTISITDTQFFNNAVTGRDGVVVVDSDSKVGDTNCVVGTTDSEIEVAPVSSSPGGSSGLCEGTVVMTEGICRPFGQVCDPDATPTLLSVRAVARESDFIEMGIASASGANAKADPLGSKSSKSSKLLKQPQQGSSSIGRDKSNGKNKNSKSSKPKRRRERNAKRGKRKLDEIL